MGAPMGNRNAAGKRGGGNKLKKSFTALRSTKKVKTPLWERRTRKKGFKFPKRYVWPDQK
jgi:hypothetical protein